MSRYDALVDWLEAQKQESVRLGFGQIEDLIGRPLPQSARNYPAFWSKANNMGRVLASGGWRAKPDLAAGAIEFLRIGKSESTPTPLSAPVHQDTIDTSKPDLVLIGCVKSKRSGTHAARDLYISTMFEGRKGCAGGTGEPWYILSAKYGLLHPGQEIASYDLAMSDLSAADRRAWSQQVLGDLKQQFGDLDDKTVEIHAGSEYRDYGLVAGLKEAGARVSVPLQGLAFGKQLSWYAQNQSAAKRGSPPQAGTDQMEISITPGDFIAEVTNTLTQAFTAGTLDLSDRPGAPVPEWESMPEFVAANKVRELGATPAELRQFLTLVAALDRARDADRLWQAAGNLYGEMPWVFDPRVVVRKSLTELRDSLARAGVSQRHTADSAAWRVIAEALIDEHTPTAITSAIVDGKGDAVELLAEVQSKTEAGQSRFPFLSGPKISAMWVRILVAPGAADIGSLDRIPVAVDTQIRKVTEYLGIANTSGMSIDTARPVIQRAWQVGAEQAVGPYGLTKTAAAIDVAVWFFGKWGCTFCERAGKQLPISVVCEHCCFPLQEL